MLSKHLRLYTSSGGPSFTICLQSEDDGASRKKFNFRNPKGSADEGTTASSSADSARQPAEEEVDEEREAANENGRDERDTKLQGATPLYVNMSGRRNEKSDKKNTVAQKDAKTTETTVKKTPKGWRGQNERKQVKPGKQKNERQDAGENRTVQSRMEKEQSNGLNAQNSVGERDKQSAGELDAEWPEMEEVLRVIARQEKMERSAAAAKDADWYQVVKTKSGKQHKKVVPAEASEEKKQETSEERPQEQPVQHGRSEVTAEGRSQDHMEKSTKETQDALKARRKERYRKAKSKYKEKLKRSEQGTEETQQRPQEQPAQSDRRDVTSEGRPQEQPAQPEERTEETSVERPQDQKEYSEERTEVASEEGPHEQVELSEDTTGETSGERPQNQPEERMEETPQDQPAQTEGRIHLEEVCEDRPQEQPTQSEDRATETIEERPQEHLAQAEERIEVTSEGRPQGQLTQPEEGTGATSEEGPQEQTEQSDGRTAETSEMRPQEHRAQPEEGTEKTSEERPKEEQTQPEGMEEASETKHQESSNSEASGKKKKKKKKKKNKASNATEMTGEPTPGISEDNSKKSRKSLDGTDQNESMPEKNSNVSSEAKSKSKSKKKKKSEKAKVQFDETPAEKSEATPDELPKTAKDVTNNAASPDVPTEAAESGQFKINSNIFAMPCIFSKHQDQTRRINRTLSPNRSVYILANLWGSVVAGVCFVCVCFLVVLLSLSTKLMFREQRCCVCRARSISERKRGRPGEKDGWNAKQEEKEEKQESTKTKSPN